MITVRYMRVSHSSGPTFVVMPLKDWATLMEMAGIEPGGERPNFEDINEAMLALHRETEEDQGRTQ